MDFCDHKSQSVKVPDMFIEALLHSGIFPTLYVRPVQTLNHMWWTAGSFSEADAKLLFFPLTQTSMKYSVCYLRLGSDFICHMHITNREQRILDNL